MMTTSREYTTKGLFISPSFIEPFYGHLGGRFQKEELILNVGSRLKFINYIGLWRLLQESNCTPRVHLFDHLGGKV